MPGSGYEFPVRDRINSGSGLKQDTGVDDERRRRRKERTQTGTHLSHPKTALTPTSAALSSGFISFPFPGAVNVRRVERIRDAIGIAGWVADGNRGISSLVDMASRGCRVEARRGDSRGETSRSRDEVIAKTGRAEQEVERKVEQR